MDPQGHRVLLVEDDDDNRELIAEVLEASGWEVVSAATGQEGLKALSEQAVDVVLTDVGMPGMGGLEMARAAKAIAPSVPVVVVTGWTDDVDVAQAHGRREVDAVLVKPIDPDALLGTVGDLAARPRT